MWLPLVGCAARARAWMEREDGEVPLLSFCCALGSARSRLLLGRWICWAFVRFAFPFFFLFCFLYFELTWPTTPRVSHWIVGPKVGGARVGGGVWPCLVVWKKNILTYMKTHLKY